MYLLVFFILIFFYCFIFVKYVFFLIVPYIFYFRKCSKRNSMGICFCVVYNFYINPNMFQERICSPKLFKKSKTSWLIVHFSIISSNYLIPRKSLVPYCSLRDMFSICNNIYVIIIHPYIFSKYLQWLLLYHYCWINAVSVQIFYECFVSIIF